MTIQVSPAYLIEPDRVLEEVSAIILKGNKVFIIVPGESRVFPMDDIDYIKDNNSGEYFVKEGLWLGGRYL